MAFCMNCGEKLPDGAKFCYLCGEKLEFYTQTENQSAYKKEAAEDSISSQPYKAERPAFTEDMDSITEMEEDVSTTTDTESEPMQTSQESVKPTTTPDNNSFTEDDMETTSIDEDEEPEDDLEDEDEELEDDDLDVDLSKLSTYRKSPTESQYRSTPTAVGTEQTVYVTSPDNDPYWDDVLPEIEEEINKIPKDIIVKGIAVVGLLLFIIVWLIYFMPQF